MTDGSITLTCTDPSCKSSNLTLVRERFEPHQRAWGGQVITRRHTVYYDCNECGEHCTVSRTIK